MKIRQKLIAILLLGVVIILLQGMYALGQMHRMSEKMRHDLAATLATGDLESAAARAQISFKTQVQEWKNILIRGNDRAQFDRYLKQFTEEEAKVGSALGEVEKAMTTAGLDIGVVRTARSELGSLGEKYRAALQGFDGADPEAGKKVDVAVRGMDRALASAMAALEKTIAEYAEREAAEHVAEAEALASSTTRWVVLGVTVGLILLALGGWRLMQSIMRSVSGLRETMLRVERDWDLSLRAPTHGSDELAQCGQVLNQMLGCFQQIVRDIHTKTDTLAQQTGSIANALSEVGRSTDAQSSSASTVAAAVEELTVSVAQVGDAAQEAQSLADASRNSALSGREAMAQGNSQLQRTSVRVDETARVLSELGARSDAISGIVQTVKEIADQTNLLALNAAIEAARAGEQGRGFAVVADEVRKLAEKTTRSTEEINALVKLIQESSVQAITDVREVVRAFDAQLGLAQQAEQAIGEISVAADQTTEASARINEAMREQTSASQLIARQIEQIATMCEESHGAVAAVDQNTRALDALAGELVDTVRRFRV